MGVAAEATFCLLVMVCFIYGGSVSSLLAAAMNIQHMEPIIVDHRIAGGRPAGREGFAYQVALHEDVLLGLTKIFCGGTILSQDFVLTAAHCFIKRNFRDVMVVSGQKSRVLDYAVAQRSPIRALLCHEEFNRQTLENDICLLALKVPIQLNRRAQPVSLPFGVTPSLRRGDCVTAGWGTFLSIMEVDVLPFFMPLRLRYAKMRALGADECQHSWGNRLTTNDNRSSAFNPGSSSSPSADDNISGTAILLNPKLNICALATGIFGGICSGDSGGPLVCRSNEDGKRYLFGVTSFSVASSLCGAASVPDVFVNVPHYLPWITTTMRK